VAQDADEPQGAGEHQPSTDLQWDYVPDNLSELPLLKAVSRNIMFRSMRIQIRWRSSQTGSILTSSAQPFSISSAHVALGWTTVPLILLLAGLLIATALMG
jgi:hypothetical protein